MWMNSKGEIKTDKTVAVFSYVSEGEISDEKADELRHFLCEIGLQGEQEEIGIYVDGSYIGISDYSS